MVAAQRPTTAINNEVEKASIGREGQRDSRVAAA